MVQALLVLQLLAEAKNIYSCGWIMIAMNPKHISKQKYILLKLLEGKKIHPIKERRLSWCTKILFIPIQEDISFLLPRLSQNLVCH